MFPPVDPTRRRFLTVAAGASFVGTGSLAAAAMAPTPDRTVTHGLAGASGQTARLRGRWNFELGPQPSSRIKLDVAAARQFWNRQTKDRPKRGCVRSARSDRAEVLSAEEDPRGSGSSIS
jgi:hypothetical protein